MSTSPQTRNFNAWINLMPGTPPQLIVVGEVETPSSNNQPKLSVSVGTAPARTLHLDLTIFNTGGIGTPAFEYHDVRHDQPASQGEFEKVVIFWDGDVLVDLVVTEVH